MILAEGHCLRIDNEIQHFQFWQVSVGDSKDSSAILVKCLGDRGRIE
jgi:hypothetical protein